MNTGGLLAALVPLVDDLSRDLPEGERYRRLLQAMRAVLPCDAAALLQLEGEWLLPLAVDGLSTDTLGRRFRVEDHPRFKALLTADGPLRFPPDCDLPDPYDGLVDGPPEALEVHDCMGCVLTVGERPWGLVTLDALDPERFATVDLPSVQAFASLAAATVTVADRIHALASRVEDERQRAEVYRVAAGQQPPRDLIGNSSANQRLLQDIAVVADSDLTVLITGETGVGKELVAQAIHAASRRGTQPLISINCAALPEALVESELFGHVRGAFSGAIGDRRGKFELADGGTLFLDEVGELSLPVQAKLLRVLQNGQLQRLGSDREHRVNVRVIAATHRDLASDVQEGRFRADVFHRLSVFPVHVAPLRDRQRDVLMLAGFFLEENRVRLGLSGLRLTADAQAALLSYAWPGNVRELEHLLSRSVLKALARQGRRPRILSLSETDIDLPRTGPAFGLDDDAADVDPDADSDALSRPPIVDPAVGLRAAVDDYERRMILDALARHGHNWASAARALGLDRANLNRLAKRLGIK
jgi:anaerobic nitric oxide reductase transcription regulator